MTCLAVCAAIRRVVRRDAVSLDDVLGHSCEIDGEILVGDEHVGALTRLLLLQLEHLDRPFAGLVDEPLLDV